MDEEPRSIVDRMHRDYNDVIATLASVGETSLQVTADDTFRKALLLSAASHFEHLLTKSIDDFVNHVTGTDDLVRNLVRNRVITRQFHSWFDWTSPNVNKFYSMFGDNFKRYMTAKVTSAGLDESMRAFIELGNARNVLVHSDYGNYVLEKTAQEVYDRYLMAVRFVEFVPLALAEYSSNCQHN